MRRALIAAVVLVGALALVPQALGGIAEVRDSHGRLVANGGQGSFGSLSDAGWTLRYDSATRSVRGVGLRGVSLAGGLVYADRIFVPAHGLRGARVSGLMLTEPSRIMYSDCGSSPAIPRSGSTPGRSSSSA